VHLLTAEKLAVFRGERLVLNGISFALKPGGMVVLRGANGAGKSTLLRALAGLTPLAAGRLCWDGVAVERYEHAARVAWLGHLDAVKPMLTAAEHVPVAALAAVGLERFGQIPARLLSAGQKRRLAIARVFCAGRVLWLLDEPTTGLDAASVARFAELCASHRAAGGMIVASTHTPLAASDVQELSL
jgi:heme exporter protein A